jgi:glycosyltransferase involved in cell wall biosynthesis
MDRYDFSVVILTYNEVINIEDCINSVRKFSNDIVVLDSFSEDETVIKAQQVGARIVENEFVGYASQRNFALNKISYKNDWVFMLDADERFSLEMIKELNSVLDIENLTMLRCRRKDMFLGKWLKRSSGYPTWFARCFKVGFCKVEREINEEYVTEGEVYNLQSHLEHLPFNKGVEEWFNRHNQYSTMESKIILQKSNKIKFKDLFAKDPSLKRAAQKALVYNLPMRPVWVFVIFYFIKLGFLDGRAGFYYCLMKFNYELMISCKVASEKG